MSDANPQQEPSMEEILASIRRIISEDDQPAEEAGAEAEADTVDEPEAEPEAEAADDVLELTEIAEEDSDEEPAAEAEEAEAAAEPEEAADEELSIDDVLDEVDVPDDLELREDDEAPEPAEPVEAVAAPAAEPEESSLLANDTSTAAGGMLGSLVAAVDRAHGGSTLGDGNRTIEDLVKEVMRPMVKEWLDENLPDLTERLVRREIERLARRAEDD